MAFNISGSADWEVPEIGEKLWQTFDEGRSKKQKRKLKQKLKNNRLKAILSKEGIKQDRKCLLKTPASSSVVHKINHKVKKRSRKLDEEQLLNRSISSNKSKYMNERKRKNNINLNNDAHALKKAHSNIQSSEREEIKTSLTKKRTKVKTPKEPAVNVKSQEIPKNINGKILKKRKEQLEKLKRLISHKDDKMSEALAGRKERPVLTLRQKMMSKLKAARFRFLNEQIYSTTSTHAAKIFRQDPEAFKAYHQGYKLQVKKWPLNPLDKIIKCINKMDKSLIVADFGCGEAKLSKSVPQKVHSFDLVAANDTVTACDMANVPLEDSSVDIVVFCLSLMGTNLKDYLFEANRVLKKAGLLKVAEVESRFEDVNSFAKNCESFGFKKTWMDLSYNLFYFIDFKKEKNIMDRKKLPSVTLLPCLYKKR